MKNERLRILSIVAITFGLIIAAHAQTVAHWTFDQGTPGAYFFYQPVPDQSGNGYTMFGFDETFGPKYSSQGDTASGTGLSARFDGVQDGYTLDSDLNNWSPSIWTIEVTVKLDTLVGFNTMIGRDGSSEHSPAADFYLQNSGENQRFEVFLYTVGGRRYVLYSDFVPVTGQWYGLAVVCDDTTLTMYANKLDGAGYQSVASVALDTSVDNSLATTGGTWTFGRGWFDGNYVDQINGNLDNIRFSEGALTPNQFLPVVPWETPVGTDVVVAPEPTVTMTFDDVTGAGTTTVTTSTGGPPPPAGFKLGTPPTYYEISTTATFAGDVQVCIDYSSEAIASNNGARERRLKLLHWNGVSWDDVTDTGYPDIVNNLICGTTTSLSPFIIAERENVPPEVTILEPASGYLAPINSPVTFSGSFADDGEAGTHSAQWIFSSATTSDIVVPAMANSFSVSDTLSFSEPGIYSIKLVVADDEGESGEATTVSGELPAYVVIYDPEGGFVSGGGWIWSPPGAFHPGLAKYESVEGKATFGFVSKYKKGVLVPTGQTEFQFKAGDLNFHSGSYQWLVVAGARAQFKGNGTISGVGEFGFMLTGIDSKIPGGGDADRFRIKIWDIGTDVIVYDNQAGSDDAVELDEFTVLQGGSIVIHKK